MKSTRYLSVVGFILSVLAPLSANAWELYEYRMRDGSVLYTDQVSTRGRFVEVLQEPPPDARRIEAERVAKLKHEAARAGRIASLRMAKLSRVEAEIRHATRALEAARAALKSGLEPLPGERLGTVGGHSRLSDAYWSRVHKLRQALKDARERLDDAYVARAALQ